MTVVGAWSAGSTPHLGATRFPRVHGADAQVASIAGPGVCTGWCGRIQSRESRGRKTTGQCGRQRRRCRLSIRLMSQVWEDPRIQSQPELLVLLALADHARDDGVCWPSIRTIAAKARVEKRSAQRILRRLIEKGLVELVTKGGCIDGHNVPNRYRVTG